MLILVSEHLILPGDNLLGGDTAHFELCKVRQQFRSDDVVFGSPGVFLKPSFHICRVEIHEALKGHVQIGAGLVELFAFLGLCLPFCLESALLRLLAFSVPVGIAIDRAPGIGLFFFVNCH